MGKDRRQCGLIDGGRRGLLLRGGNAGEQQGGEQKPFHLEASVGLSSSAQRQ